MTFAWLRIAASPRRAPENRFLADFMDAQSELIGLGGTEREAYLALREVLERAIKSVDAELAKEGEG